MTNKLIREGKVAVLYSPSYGAWYSSHGNLDLVFHSALVALVLAGKGEEITHQLITALGINVDTNYIHPNDVRWLEVGWVPQGVMFRIGESESGGEIIVLQDEHEWIKA